MNFSKYHALGNVYFIIEPDRPDCTLSKELIISLCDQHYGIGSDGILLGPLPSVKADFKLQILNPDGSEAEKSGNGLRIFSRYLLDKNLVSDQPFSIETLGGIVHVQIFDEGRLIQVEMGLPSFNSKDIPVVGVPREVLNEPIQVLDRSLIFNAVSMGNPHCVIFCDEVSEQLATKYGPVIENHRFFPARTNVQFVKIIDRDTIQIEIWERGAGYTFASGSSSCAAVAVAHRLGHCTNNVKVIMRGGELDINIDDAGQVTMRGPVTPICEGHIFAEYWA